MNICTSANSKYLRYLCVMLTSFFENNEGEENSIYILHRDFTEKDKNIIMDLVKKYHGKVTFCFVDENEFMGLPTDEHLTLETYFRLSLIKTLPNMLHRILYLDVDIIVDGSIKELYDMDLGSYCFGAGQDLYAPNLNLKRQELFNRNEKLKYYNCGVMLWNLEQLRKEENLLEIAKKNVHVLAQLPCADQEIVNMFFYEKIKSFDAHRWNYLVLIDLDKNMCTYKGKTTVYHFCNISPWRVGPKSEKYKKWWAYARKTPYYQEFLEELLEMDEKYALETYALSAQLTQKNTLIRIQEKLCYLKGKYKLKQRLEREDKKLVIYGAGVVANLFYEVIAYEGMEEHVTLVLDRNKKEFHGRKVTNSLEKIALGSDVTIVIALSHEEQSVKQLCCEKCSIGTKVYTIEEFLEGCI